MDTATLVGALLLGIPLVIVSLVLLRQQPRAIQLFSLALIVVGLGYLMAVGATGDIARTVAPSQFPSSSPVPVKA